VGDAPRNKRYHIKWGQEGYSPDAGRQAVWAYFGFAVNDLPNGLTSKDKIDAFAASKASVELAPGALPLLVRFRDIGDLSTVEIVDPDNFSAAFGPGVKIARVHAEVVDEPVTTGIVGKLKWWASSTHDQRSGPYWNPRDSEAKNVQYHLLKTDFVAGGR
jgi:hypothetical protein